MFRCLRLRKHFPKHTNHKKWLDLLVSLQTPVNKYAQNTGTSGTTAHLFQHLLPLDIF